MQFWYLIGSKRDEYHYQLNIIKDLWDIFKSAAGDGACKAEIVRAPKQNTEVCHNEDGLREKYNYKAATQNY